MNGQVAELGQDQAVGHKRDSDSETQGHLPLHEKQSSASSLVKTTTMDDQSQQHPTVPSSAPQVRSRITVVCAECKRLKLKCDRRTPCGSCSKRDTVSRCIYSPAAAEKVDLHSLNNRLIQVEATLAMMTAGKIPPPFQSSYPLAQVVSASTQSPKSSPSHAPLTLPSSSISIKMDDLVNIWLTNCQLDLFTPVKAETPQDNTFVKLEPSSVDLVRLATPYPENTIIIDETPTSAPVLPVSQHNLPPLQVYYGQDGQIGQDLYDDGLTSFIPEHDFDPATSQRPTFPATLYASTRIPRVPQAVFARLPPPSVRLKLLDSALAVNPYLNLLVPWSRLAELADPAIKAEKERKTVLAHNVFGIHQTPPLTTPAALPITVSPPLFACLCYSLSLGALELGRDVAHDHTFLYALASQAINIWEEYKALPHGKEDARDLNETHRSKQAEREKDEMDHLVASLLQVKYLLRLGSSPLSKNTKKTMEMVFPLIGKLVNMARSLGIAKDPEEDLVGGIRRTPKAEERRRMIWWDIMFYDIFTSDTLDCAPLVSLHSYTTRIPHIAESSAPEVSDSRDAYPSPSEESGDIGHEADLSSEAANADESVHQFAGTMKAVRAKSKLLSPQPTRGKEKAHRQSNEDVGFFGIRCRVTRLAQTLKHRLSHPGCDCCACGYGYMLDQAAKLEAEIRAWVADLPSFLQFDASSPLPDHEAAISATHCAVSAELTILANRMIIAAYVPTMRPSSEIANSSASAGAYSAAHPWSPASRATVDAAQSVIRASSVLQRFMQNGNISPVMGEYYPLNKAVADALVICVHSGLATGKPGRPIMEEAMAALDVINDMGGCDGELGRIVASLKRRLEGCEVTRSKPDENSLKRKHSVLENLLVLDGYPGTRTENPVMSVDDHHLYEQHEEASQQLQQQRYVPLPPSPPRTGYTSRSKTGDKRPGKKGPTSYPTVGFRDRGKEGAPWMIKKTSPMKRDMQSGSVLESGDNSNNFPSISPQTNIPQDILESGYRSRSSSINQAPPEYGLTVGGSEDQTEDVRAMQRRRYSIQESRQPPSHSESMRGFTVSPTSLFNPQSSQSSRSSSYDHHRGSFDQTAGISAESVYRGPTSPYNATNSSLSAASSPYESAHGHPSTFGSISHKHSPSTFGPQSSISSPQTYFEYETYDAQQQNQPLNALSLGPSMTGQGQVINDSMSIPSTPIYENGPQQTMYDIKAVVDIAQQQGLHHYQVTSGRITPVDTLRHMTLNASSQQAWTPTPSYMTQQQQAPVPGQQDTQYWNAEVYYRQV